MFRKVLVGATGALVLAALFGTSGAQASSPITVNKTFTPNSIGLGQSTQVVVTLENSNTTSAAAITAFSDNLDTMAGIGIVDTSTAPTTTCAGGTPTITGADQNTITMNNGSIPQAPSAVTPGSCTITFNAFGNKAGSGQNTILAANVVTSLGSPGGDIQQSLLVAGANVTVSSSPTVTTIVGGTGTLTFTVKNPAVGIPLTTAGFFINATSTQAFTISSATSDCGGAVTEPPIANGYQITLAGGTIPANGTCTITVNTTSALVSTVNFTLPANSVTDDQAATNSGATSNQDKFVIGNPNISKSFNPTAVLPSGTTTVTVNIQNILTSQTLGAGGTATIVDPLTSANMTLDAVPNLTFNGNCGAPTIAGAGTGTATISSIAIPANATCTLHFIADVSAASGSVTNTIPAANFTSPEVPSGASGPASASLLVTGPGGGVSLGKGASPNSAGPNTPVLMTLTFNSLAGQAFTNGSFTDNLPQQPAQLEPMAVYVDGTHAASTSNCGADPLLAITAVNGATSVSGTHLSVPANGTCTVKFYAIFTQTTPGVSRTVTNRIGDAGDPVSFQDHLGNTIGPSGTASANITELPVLTLTNYSGSGQNLINQPITIGGSIDDPSGTPDTNLLATFNLNPGSVKLATPANFVFGPGCPTGANAPVVTPLGESFTISVPAISATCTFTYSVIDEGGAANTFTPGSSSYTSGLTGGAPSQAFTGTNSVTFATSNINVTKIFTPNQIQAGATSTVSLTTSVVGVAGFTQTQANGVTYSDNLPANVVFAPTPNVTFSPQCQVAGQPAPSFVIAGSTITFSNISLLTVGAVTQPCVASFVVTSDVLGAPLNQIPANSITSTSGIKNSLGTTASLTVAAGVAVQKTYVSSTLPIGSTDYIRFLLTNSVTSSVLNGGAIVDNMPATLVLASTTLGPQQAGDPLPLCGGSITAGAVGSSNFTVGNLTLGGTTGGGTIPGQCEVYVLVGAAPSAAPGPTSNTIGVGQLTIGGYANQTASTGTNSLTPAPNVVLSKAFSPSTIAPGGTSTLTITFANTAANAAPLSAMALTDTLPANVKIAAVPAGATTCGAGTVTAVGGGNTVALAGGTVAANATCTVTVSVTSSTSGIWTNQIPASSLTTTQGATNGSPVSAPLNVGNISPVGLTKTFVPAAISPGGTSVLTLSFSNTAGSALPLTALGVTDGLPVGVVVAPVPNATTTCPAGSVIANAGSTTVVLSGATLAVGASCTVSVTVTAAAAGIYVNGIAASAVSDGQGSTNPAPAQATLNVGNTSGVTLAKVFAPTTIQPGGNSLLTISVINSSAGAVPLSNVALTDTLPANLSIAPVPNASTTCGAAAVSAAAGSNSVGITGGSLGAGGTCTITVSVTSLVAGTYVNTIPAGALTDAQVSTNPSPAQASLNVVDASGVTISKTFAPVSIPLNGISTLTIAIANTSPTSVALTGMTLSDTLPANVKLAPAPNASTTCGAGVVSAVAGSGTVGITNGTIAANATCTITVSVTSATAGIYVNTIPASSLTDVQGSTNASPAQATLNVGNNSGVTITKSFAPVAIAINGISTLTLGIENTSASAVPLTGIALTDALPANVKIAPVPNASTTCGPGVVAAVSGAGSVSLSGGTVGANAGCSITVSVTSANVGLYVNTIPASALTDAQGSTNAAPAQATLNVGNVSNLTVAKAFAPAVIAPGASSTLTISIANTAANAVALTALTLTDALPANITIAAVPNAATTCTGGIVSATGGSSSVSLSAASLAANATCTITVSVTGTLSGSYTNTIPASDITTAQGATNSSPAQATLTIGQPLLNVKKTSNPGGASVSPGETITYTITIVNNGTQAETNAHVTDVLTNATLVPGSVTVNGSPAADAVVTAAQPFGTIAIGATATITYQAVVNTAAPTGAVVTNGATVGGDQPCTGANCSATSPPNAVSAPILSAVKQIDQQVHESVLAGQTVTYSITVSNTGTSPAINTVLTDPLPNGVTAIPGTITVSGVPSTSSTIVGQNLTVPIGTINPGTSVVMTFNAKIAPGTGTASNTVSVTATGLTRPVLSNAAVATQVPPTLTVTKTTSATTVSVGDRVDYAITVTSKSGIGYGATTVLDLLPQYEAYAPGTARVNGKPQEPIVRGNALTWQIPALNGTVTITYATVISPGATANQTLTNVAIVNAIAPGGAGLGNGSASAAVLVVGSTFGSCYPITGRVYLDAKGSGRFEDPDTGIANVRIFLDTGESVLTDRTGRYDFPCVHPGMHALRLDERTLPAGAVPYDDRSIDSEKSIRRLVHRLFDTTIIEDINFAVKPVK